MLRKRRGQHALEFLFGFVMLLTLTCLTLEVGRIILTEQTVASASYVGARRASAASLQATKSVGQQAALQHIKNNMPFYSAGKTVCNVPEPVAVGGTLADGMPLSVSVTCRVDPMFTSLFLPQWASYTLTKQTTILLNESH